MEQITIQIKNKQKAQALINFLKSLDFIDELTTQDSPFQSEVKVNDADFFALAGIWAGRDITLETIRLKAWPPRV
ncbi:MAG: hypothetical protein KF758_05515 [Anaerolineales bacterium]|nr:hypothetical protein [Anaerolineales bacterium]MBX3036354.1 hypothetical protein [Anaerolineales bacterium]